MMPLSNANEIWFGKKEETISFPPEENWIHRDTLCSQLPYLTTSSNVIKLNNFL